MTVVIVHDNITVNGIDCQRGDKLFGENAEAALANPIWARSVTRAPDGVHDEPTDAPIQVPAPSAAPVAAPTAAATVAMTLTDTTNKSS